MASTGEPEPDSLYAHETREENIPWWQSNAVKKNVIASIKSLLKNTFIRFSLIYAFSSRNFLLNQPVLFGTWDGVFTTVMVNIFGIIVFLRMGWIVGTAGVANAILLLAICTALAMITVFSAIGIVERCQIQSGGIYFLVSHVLGGRLGGAVGLIYALGQAVATGLVAVGFAESVAHLFDSESRVFTKVIAIATLLLLTVSAIRSGITISRIPVINTAGVSWVVRLQLLLLGFLALAVLDFLLGALFTSDPSHGISRFSYARLRENADPFYSAVNCTPIGFDRLIPNQSFFTVFGVFFANFLGVLAGVNMSGDLKDPHKSIPLGELSAVGVSSSVCFLFIMILGATGDRLSLICDNLISEKVALTGFLFMIGLYICSLSSTIGSLLGTPRVLQGIAAEGIIPILNPLAQGSGPNKNPVLAGIVLMAVASVFVLLGDLNQLAILSTMPFLITYAFVNYAYVSLAMSYDLATISHAAEDGTKYGSMHKIGDLDELFPERQQQQCAATVEAGAIVGQPATWYSMFSNRYISFVGFMVNLLILFLIHFWFAVAHFAALIILYYYIGRVCTACTTGISTFSIPHMFRTAFSSLEAIGVFNRGPCVLTKEGPSKDVLTEQLNESNTDYQDRKQYHHAENVTQEFD
ncbi:amino acid permease [Necator americanus]|uniref:Amino acid permease n=1 Tax=Necator americanus TaxID=51031 RepID=W2SNC6_NECAM|nr:amino acid permease [Necator americanus]ETN71038.1 amino acid permease [Necator americanus]